MKYILIIVLIFLTTSSFLFGQSPWTQEKGHLFSQLSYSVIPKYNSIYTKDGEAFNTARFISDKTIQLYGEYGVLKNTTILVNLPLSILAAGDSSDVSDVPVTISMGRLTALGNLEFGVRQKIYSGVVEVSGQLNLKLPTHSFDSMTGLRSGFDAVEFLPAISIGKSIENGYVYGFFGAGIKTNNYSSSVKWGLEGGYKFVDRFYLMVFLNSLHSLNNGSRMPDVTNTQTGLYLNNQEYIAFGIKALLEIRNGFGITGGFGGAASGNLVARSPSLNIGVFYRLNP